MRVLMHGARIGAQTLTRKLYGTYAAIMVEDLGGPNGKSGFRNSL
jgi:hypothetical protein